MADAIIVSNLKITPYTQKDGIAKIVYGDEWSITIKLPTPHVTGDKYAIGIDYENTLYPPNRPLCAGSELYVLNDDELTFTLKLATARLRDWCSKLKKPMPIAIQIVRIRDNKAETLLLDSLLALPSVFDGVVTVYEGDALDERLDEKMDNPPTEGEAGQVLGINEDGQIVWTTIEIPEQEQADWDESDSEAKSYIRNKPELATVATTGSYNDLTDKPEIPEQKQADWDESDTESPAYIANKPVIPTVNDGKITVNQGGVKKGEFTVNQSGDTVIELNDGAQSNWDESDSSNLAYIFNKPVIPEAQVQVDWDESDSSDVSFIKNKPDLNEDPLDYLCFTAVEANSTVFMKRYSSRGEGISLIENKDIEYSTDKKTWTQYQWNNQWNSNRIDSGTIITLTNVGDKVWFRGNNNRWSYQEPTYYIYRFWFAMTGKIAASGDVIYLASKKGDVKKAINLNHLFAECQSLVAIPKLGFTELTDECYSYLFGGCTSLNEVPYLPAQKMEKQCYEGLFSGCTSLKYPPALPSVQLAESCYRSTFNGCTALEIAPELPATTLESMCYNNIFDGCTKIDHVKVGFSDWAIVGNWDSAYKTHFWLRNVSATGVLECPATLDTSIRDDTHVPSGWSVVWTTSVQSDWDESDSTEASFIKNKPTIQPQQQADWDESDSSEVSFILNKPTIPYDALDYLCFEAKEANSTVGLNKVGSPDAVSLEYSTDKANWTAYTWESGTGTTITLTNVGDRVWFRGDNSGYCKTVIQHYHKFVGTGSIAVSGNIMSLVDKTCESKVIPSEWCFCGLFSGFTALVDAQELSLPAMTLKRACYYMLFDGCKSLVNAPEILPAMTLVQNCYGGFFYNCTALVNASYLPAKTLVQNCYTNLFYGCSSLNYVKVGFLANSPTVGSNWMAGVSATGTFECPSALDCSNRMGNCIPSGWTIVRSDSVQADWGESIASSPAYVLNKGISTEVAVSDSTYTVNAGTTVPVITVASSLTLSADTVASGKVGYAEVVLDIADGATVTAGSNITFVDTLEAGKRNVCVVRWSGGTSKLYVTIVEDLDESASN